MKTRHMLAIILISACFAGLVAAGGKDGADARLTAIDARLAELTGTKERLLSMMRTQLDEVEKVKGEIEKEDADCRRLRQKLQELDAEAAKIKEELDKRFAAVDRYVKALDGSKDTAAKLNAMVEEERRLGLEKRALSGKQSARK